ncbi:DUF4435 domain-containing protein [Vibrio vulnificus]|uniref:DUF4435 domain-containing protein n=1 Tax=Vibrio vulnificus TaxID=672 RepID=UPI001A249B1E|nr:DUF4435 domain-containing protein [Vibrio vulnificus]MCA3984047.1 DUF4435 domain-containing protein [Vibrio vulnificus]MCU8549258.1 DUF4435 domain-containing protein [Vibrio vulnificus]MCU8579797.1 DUF4435 domain-containing protein [Vibrio vulnificus]HAS8223422.1 DUF4435 domain-containing protein [Vibrio vulnificus]HAS8277668.1 DUF4435 domain-containing protein [Vibrio vulnificus]
MSNANLCYDLQEYIAKVKMSSKLRLLVEGRDDKTHITNLLRTLDKSVVRIDTAEQIKGDCKKTSKNNRAKIDKIFSKCGCDESYNNLYYLCDREFFRFKVRDRIIDELSVSDFVHNLCWTSGHSMENYFLDASVITDSYRFLCNSEYKWGAIDLFESLLPSIFKLVASISLAAKQLELSSYPMGVFQWDDFKIDGTNIIIDSENSNHRDIETFINFIQCVKHYEIVSEKSPIEVCTKICRGHTAMVLLQRIFSKCLYTEASKTESNETAIRIAKSFSSIKESQLASCLGESWARHVSNGNTEYPKALIDSIA